MNKGKAKRLIFDFILLIVLIALDQFTKYIAVIKLKDKAAFNIIDGVLEFNYLENKGAAFGMFQNQKIFFIFVAVILLGIIIYVLLKMPEGIKYSWLHILLVMLSGGAIGNMIDRIRFDYVVDFIYFSLINFPIFNVADMYVTVSMVIIVLLILFVFREEDFNFLSFKAKKFRKPNE